MGFLDDLARCARFQAAINVSKGKTGKPDPCVAAGIVMGMGKGYSMKDAALLGAMLGSQGAFDDDNKIH